MVETDLHLFWGVTFSLKVSDLARKSCGVEVDKGWFSVAPFSRERWNTFVTNSSAYHARQDSNVSLVTCAETDNQANERDEENENGEDLGKVISRIS